MDGEPAGKLQKLGSYAVLTIATSLNTHQIMQLPNFDIKSGEDGYRFRKLAGMDILREVQRKRKACKVIVVTQFETFGENESYIELKDLKKMIEEQYGNLYIDTVFYSANQSIWKKKLKEIITTAND